VQDVTAGRSEEELAELAALADGTLPAERRAEVEARVAASPELQELLERQRRAVLAARALADENVPASLRAAVGRSVRPRRAWTPRVALAGAAVAAAAVVASILLTGGPGAPSVADAARLAAQTATAPAPAVGTPATTLALEVGGVPFPNLTLYGWRASGVRHGRIGGRDATAVFYRKDGRRLGYVIVSGAGLHRPSDAEATWIRQVEYETLSSNGSLTVTWRRGGHTCVLLGHATRAELLKLASWPVSPRR
jgi:anti-sigma factor RsiW